MAGITIALVGNPNCGKTTMFNALTGANQYVGNWPGVTVEKKEGKARKFPSAKIVDLPGIYSLSPYTLEEVVSRNYLLDERPDVILNLVDATNIERNLYLTNQLIETGLPIVVALNMTDLLEKNDIHIDVEKLSSELGCPVVETSALKGKGLDKAVEVAIKTGEAGEYVNATGSFDPRIEEAIAAIKEELPNRIIEQEKRWYAVKVLENDPKILEKEKFDRQVTDAGKKERDKLEKSYDDDIDSIMTDARYTLIQEIIKLSVRKKAGKMTLSDKIDAVVTNKNLRTSYILISYVYRILCISYNSRYYGYRLD